MKSFLILTCPLGQVFWRFQETIKPEFWTNTLRKSLQTTSALSATSKQCFEQPAASFLVCSLIFIEYKNTTLIEKFSISQILSKRLHSSFYWIIIGWYKALCNNIEKV